MTGVFESTSAPPYPEGRNLLAGKSVLVTASAGTGIGFATAKRCAEEGATVMLSDIHEGRLERCADELAELVGQDVPRALCDIRSSDAVAALVTRAESELGGIDVLVNNAGLGMTRKIIDTSSEEWLRLLDINLKGPFRTMRAALPAMIERGSGSIINLSSICAWRAEAGQSAYGASKAGVLALTRCAAMESAESGVRINALVPSLAIHPHLEKVSSPEFLAKMVRENEVLGRGAETWEIGNAAVFLASDYSSYMTGEALSVSCRRA
ncbi:MAG: SDR family oxidoreductase [bacterium]|nr:short chain dehydrogenase [Deltaproteobacteria bacterium]MCP4906109.1 SDR family oxidoreductase [bacterium]